ncbi:hypothetical protein [Paenibacillus tepidiphilus]|uniref:hypothetical protein n=1 Tax=Paenibacillus tepidiphilus TaxID=2608683 RepID=UPI001239226B|nr:hypothetical protein [Paenibacillus tepidiphilus]
MKQFFIVFTCCIVFFLTGCTQNKTASSNGEFTALRQKEMNILLDKINDKNVFVSAQSIKDFNVRAEADLYIEDNISRIVYNVIVDEAKIHMNNVTISFLLEDNMNVKQVTNDVFFTNLNDDGKTLTDLQPDGEVKGTTAFRAFIINSSSIDQEFLEIYKKVYVHISWENPDKTHRSEFILVNAEPSKKLMNYLNENKPV